MSPTPTTPFPLRPGEPTDPELRERYLTDAARQREQRRAEAVRLAAETPPSRTPSGPIKVVAALVTIVLVLGAGALLLGPVLKQTTVTEQALAPGTSRVVLDNAVGDIRVRVAERGEEPRVIGRTEWGLRRPDVSVGTTGDTANLRASCPSGFVTVCSTEWTVVVADGTDLDVSQGVGRVDIEALDGDIDVEAGVGDITVSESAGDRIHVQVGVGAARVEAVEPPEDVNVRVGVGDLGLRLPDTVDYDIFARGGMGEVSNHLGSTPGAERRVRVEGGVGQVSIGPA